MRHLTTDPERTVSRHVSLKWTVPMILTAIGGPLMTPLAAQGGPPPEVRAMIDGTVAMLRATDDSTLHAYAEKTLAPDYREQFTGDELTDHFSALRAAVAKGDGTVSVRGPPGSVVITFAADGSVLIRLDWNDDIRVTKLADESPGG
jgi:hypothetical protein